MRFNSKLFKIITKKTVAFALAFILSFNMSAGAVNFYAEESVYSENITPDNIGTLGGKLELTENEIIIDNVKVKKDDFIKALSKIKKAPDGPLSVSMLEYSQQLSDSAKQANSLAYVGLAVKGVFMLIAYKMALAGIRYTGPYIIPKDTFNGVERSIYFTIHDDVIVFYGKALGMNWLSYVIAEYLSENEASIEEAPSFIFPSDPNDGKTGEKDESGQEKGNSESGEDSGGENGENNNAKEDLTNVQKSKIRKIENTIRDHLKESDLSAAKGDLEGNPIPDPKGGYYQHIKEVLDGYLSLQMATDSLEGSLRNPNLSDIHRKLIQEAVDKAYKYMNRIEEIFGPYGGVQKWLEKLGLR